MKARDVTGVSTGKAIERFPYNQSAFREKPG